MNPPSTFADPFSKAVIALLGNKKFIALKDIEFLLAPQNQPDLQAHKQSLEALKKKIVISGIATTSFIIITNAIIQKKILATRQISNLRLFVWDLTLYSATALMFINYTAQNMFQTTSDLWKVKTQLILSHNKKYLAHIRQNSISYRFSIEQQTEGRNLSYLDIEEMMKKIGNLRFDKSGQLIQEL